MANGDARARARIHAARLAGDELIIPAVVLAEVVRGRAADAPVNRVIKAVGVLPGVDDSIARRAGALLAEVGSRSTIDALVVATSLAAGASTVLHHDADDLPPLCAAAGLVDWHIR